MCTQTSKDAYRETRELSILFETTQWLHRTRSLNGVAAPLLRRMAEEMEMRRGTITILNRDTGELTIEASYGLTPEQRSRGRYRLGEGVTGLVVQSGKPAVVPRISEEPLFLDRTGARSRDKAHRQNDLSFLCVPIRLIQDTIGALSVDRVYSEDTAYPEDIRLLTIMASLIAYPAHLRQASLERRRSSEGPPEAGADGRMRPLKPEPVPGLEDFIERKVSPSADRAHPPPAAPLGEAVSLGAMLNTVEKEMISDALKASHGKMAAAARRLGLTERMMGLRVHKHGIDLKPFKRPGPDSSCLP